MATENGKKPILDINTARTEEREFINIDGQKCPILSRDEFSLRDQHEFVVLGRHLQDFFAKVESVSDEDIAKAEAELFGIIKKIVIAEDELLKALSDNQKLKIITTIFQPPEVESATETPAQDSTQS